MDSSLHLVPGRYKLPTAPGRSLRKDGPGWETAENKFTATSGLPAVCLPCAVRDYIAVFVYRRFTHGIPTISYATRTLLSPQKHKHSLFVLKCVAQPY